eukprot:SAG22_NODE_11310_length_491_cov_0.653061_1_plen_130_part_01
MEDRLFKLIPEQEIKVGIRGKHTHKSSFVSAATFRLCFCGVVLVITLLVMISLLVLSVPNCGPLPLQDTERFGPYFLQITQCMFRVLEVMTIGHTGNSYTLFDHIPYIITNTGNNFKVVNTISSVFVGLP